MAEYGSIEAPEPPQESFLSSEPTPVPAPRRKLRYAGSVFAVSLFILGTCGLATIGAFSVGTAADESWLASVHTIESDSDSEDSDKTWIPMKYEGTYQSGYEKGSYCKLTGCTGGYMCAQGGSLLTKFDSDNIDVRDDNYKMCQPEVNHFDGGTRCTGAVNLPADTNDKCVRWKKPDTHGWACCELNEKGEYLSGHER